MSYDLLGRMTQRVEAEGTSTWTYDLAANGKGKLANVTGPSNGFSIYYYYNADGLKGEKEDDSRLSPMIFPHRSRGA